MCEYTVWERQAIHKAFKNAVDYLRVKNTCDEKYTFICHAIVDGNPHDRAASRMARKIIEDRISPYSVVNEWLTYCADVPIKQLTDRNLQQYRMRWLQSLIEEFSQ